MRQALGVLFGLVAPALAGLAGLAGILNLQDTDVIPGKYIISLIPGADSAQHLSWVRDVHRRSLERRGNIGSTAGLEKTYGFGDFSAYAGEFDVETILQILSSENVLHVEADRAAYLTSVTQQTNAPWGLEALSSQTQVSDGHTRGHTYRYDSSGGEGTYAYVLDSGVLTNNTEFGGRAIKGYNAWDGTESFDDHFGHGTHVAGTIASNSYGVAKKATVVDVKVVRSYGYSTVAHVLDGINWVVNNATGTPGRAAKSVINMSLAFTASSTLNAAVDAAATMGILSVVGAGNDNADASTRSPASAPSALAVGAVTWNRTRADFSNYGPCVSVFAPGVDVASLWNAEGVESVNSGTSMSSPHVAGLALYLKGLESGLDSPADTIARVKQLAIAGVVADAGAGSPNLLAYNGVP
ncbi:subtilisin-like serine protease pepD [Hypoxylon rubiginosum]|uniref:Subtilisin-like serine protease pepD n=1 Tax=Hypoxylon rubiginosum TaxID=110542 RepID=A0ACC0D547_9PEZI|nr:subtilisin-like serine protease pepD [Hypoxylon rubiginosum]